MVDDMPTHGELQFDCAAKADREGQPAPFVLIASDPLAPWLVDLWRELSEGDTIGAVLTFAGMIDAAAGRYLAQPRSPEKVDSAEAIARNMRNWRIERGLNK